MVAVEVRRQDAVAGVEEGRVRCGERHAVGDEAGRDLTALREAVLGHEGLVEVPEHGGPDLAVGVHLGTGEVVAHVAEGVGVGVVVVVADAPLLVARGVGADHRPARAQPGHLGVVEGVPVAPALTHRPGLVRAERAAAGDVAVRQAVAVLVLDDGHVERAVTVRALEGVVDGLPQEHAAPRRDAVVEGEHVGVVAPGVGRGATGGRAGLDEAADRVAAHAALAAVVDLEVAGGLGEPER